MHFPQKQSVLPKLRPTNATHLAAAEVLESRIAPAYTFSLSGTAASVIGTSGTDHLTISVAGGLLEYSINGGAFSTDWDTATSGTQTLAAAAASQVTVTMETGDGASVTLGAPGGFASQLLGLMHIIAPSNTSDTLVIDDSGGAQNHYMVNTPAATIKGTGINIQEGSNTFSGGITLLGSGVDGNVYDVRGVYGGVQSEPFTIVTGMAGRSTVNVGDTGGLGNIQSPLSIHKASGSTGIVEVDINDQSGASGTATIDASGDPTNPFQVTGFSPAPIRLGGVSVLVISGPTVGAAYNFNALPVTMPTTINGGTSADILNLGFSGQANGLNNLAGVITFHGGGGGDRINIFDADTVASHNYAVTNNSVFRSGFGGLVYDGTISALNISDSVGGHSFGLDLFTGTGSLTDTGSADTVTATKNASFTLTNNSLSATDGLNMTLSGITTAVLKDTGGGHSFTVSGWTGGGSLTNTGATTDTLNSIKPAGYTLSNGTLATTDLMVLSLSGIGIANLTETTGTLGFNISGWTGSGSLTDTAVSKDIVQAGASASFTLTDTSLSDTAGLNMTLSGMGSAILIDEGGAGGHSFDISGWTGGGELSSPNSDTIIATKNASFTLGFTSITATDGLNMSFMPGFGPGIANLTDTGGAHSFDVGGWRGTGSLTHTGPNADTVTANKSASFTLTDTLLTATDGLSMSLSGITVAKLTDSGGNHSFTVSGWTFGGLLTGLATDTLIASKNANYNLANSFLSATDGVSLGLSGIVKANLTDTGGGHSFEVDGWTGSGSLTNTGASTDTVTANKSASFTLTNALLTATDGMSMSLSGITVANLTDTAGNQTFTVSGWTNGGTLTGQSSDTVVANKNASYTLTNTTLTATDGMSLGLSGIAKATLMDTGGGHSFDVGGWTGGGTLANIGALADTVVASKSASYTLGNTSLTATDGLNLVLAGVTIANLTDTSGGHSFDVGGWSGTGSLTNNTPASPDAVISSKAANHTLTDTSLTATDGLNVTLSGITIANLTGSGSGNSFDVGGWTGTGSLSSTSGADTVIASKNGSFTLADTSLSATDGLSMTLNSVHSATLTDTGGAHSFTVSGWTGTGSLTNSGATTDTLIASKGANFTLANGSLAASDGLSVTVSGFTIANLTVTGGSHSVTVSGWTGTGTITGTGASDSISATKNGDFTLGNTSLVTTDGMSLTLASVGGANLTGGAGNNTFTVSAWTGTGSLTGGGGSDSAVATKGLNLQITDSVFQSTDHMNLALSGIQNANVTASAGHLLFDASGFTGTLHASGGGFDAQTLIAGKGINYLDDGGGGRDRYVLSGSSVLDVVKGKGAGNLIDYFNDTSGTGVKVNLSKSNVYTTNIGSLSTSVVVQNVQTGVITTESLSAISGTGNLVLVGNFYNLAGSQYTDVLTGNKFANVIYGGGGTNDKLTGGGGVNYLFGNKTTKFGASAGTDFRTRSGKDPFIPVLAWNGGTFTPNLLPVPIAINHFVALPPAVVAAVADGLLLGSTSLL